MLANINLLPLLKKENDLNSLKIDDIYSFGIIEPLLTGHPYLPFNGGALRPMGLAYILNEIIINNRKSILEFGAGITTIMIARLIKQNNLNLSFYSVEHNSNWIKTLKTLLSAEGLNVYVNFIHAELTAPNSESNANWYDTKRIENHIKDITFDLVIVDGPPANFPEIEFSRMPVLEFLKKRLDHNFCIFIDDANRKGEKKLISEFEKRFSNNISNFIGKTFFVSYSHTLFNPVPLHY